MDGNFIPFEKINFKYKSEGWIEKVIRDDFAFEIFLL